ncbi:MAG: hypothetical protein ACR2GW_06885, partial [Pyrinomonadaceae bacterium]
PLLGNLFKSKSFQKQETELMFIVTANLVKPMNSDDLPQLRGVDGLKTASPLGVEPKGEGITGDSGYSTGGGSSSTTTTEPAVAPATPSSAPKPASPAGAVAPKSGDDTAGKDSAAAVAKATAPGEAVAPPKQVPTP